MIGAKEVLGIGEWFELEYSDPGEEKRVHKVKLVRLGQAYDLNEARQKAEEMGYRLVGRWAIEAFVAEVYYVGVGPVVFGGSTLLDQKRGEVVACLYAFEDRWQLDCRYADGTFGTCWGWLVTASST